MKYTSSKRKADVLRGQAIDVEVASPVKVAVLRRVKEVQVEVEKALRGVASM